MFIVFPTLGLLEAIAGIFVLGVHRPMQRIVTLIAIVPTVLVLVFAILSLIGSDVPDHRFTVAIASGSALTTLVLVRTAAMTKPVGLQFPWEVGP
jgi:uncharacterized membrane protein